MKLAYREAGHGTPLIILHGLFGQSDNWNTLAKKFAENQFRVFTVDQRNHGLSPHSSTWTYEAMAEDLHDLIIEQRLENPILLGHSMGGKTVMHFEKLYPGAAAKLIIVDISAREYPAHHQDVLTALHAVDFKKIKTRKEAETVLNHHIDNFGTKQFLLKNIYWKDTANNEMAWRFNLDVISDQYDNIRYAVPMFTSNTATLVVRGERSRYVSEDDIEDFKKRFHNCTFVTIADAAHWVHAEKPQDFFDKVMEFIST